MKKCRGCQQEIDAKATKCPHCQADQRSWINHHPILTVIILVIVLVIAYGVLNGISLLETSNTNQSNTQTATSEAKKNSSEKTTITNTTVKPWPGSDFVGTEVDGELTNNDTSEHTALLTATFYDKTGKIMGTAQGTVSQVAPGQTKTFQLYTTSNFTGYGHYKVEVSNLF
jgi:hypothetical protein